MKKHLLSIVLIAAVSSVFAQVPATKPIVKGIIWLGQSTPPASPGLYEQYKDSDDGITYEWDGDSWEPFGAGAADGNDFPTGLNLTGTLLTLTVPNHADPSVDLAPLQDGDNQELGITGNLLTIENGTIGIDLSTYLDNTDDQNSAEVPVSHSAVNYTAGAATVLAHITGIDNALGLLGGPASNLANADQLIPAATTREVQMGDATSEILIQNSAGNASILALDDGGAFFGISARVPDLAYGPTWDGSINVPTRNAIYDKIESLMAVDIGAVAVHPESDEANVRIAIADDYASFDAMTLANGDVAIVKIPGLMRVIPTATWDTDNGAVSMNGWKGVDDRTIDEPTWTFSNCAPGYKFTVWINRASAPTLAGTGLTFNPLPGTTAFASATEMGVYFEVGMDGTTLDYYYYER